MTGAGKKEVWARLLLVAAIVARLGRGFGRGAIVLSEPAYPGHLAVPRRRGLRHLAANPGRPRRRPSQHADDRPESAERRRRGGGARSLIGIGRWLHACAAVECHGGQRCIVQTPAVRSGGGLRTGIGHERLRLSVSDQLSVEIPFAAGLLGRGAGSAGRHECRHIGCRHDAIPDRAPVQESGGDRLHHCPVSWRIRAHRGAAAQRCRRGDQCLWGVPPEPGR